MSILTHLAATNGLPGVVRVLYTVRSPTGHFDPTQILFLERLQAIAREAPQKVKLTLFLTGGEAESGRPENLDQVTIKRRRVSHEDLLDAVGPRDDRPRTVCYVCGPSKMTDGFVDVLKNTEGMKENSVLCEKWW